MFGQVPDGTRLQLRDEGEGWFQGVRELFGLVSGRVRREEDPNPWYVLQLDAPLEIQEPGHNTTSGFRLVRYSVLLTRSRLASAEINAKTACSVHVCLVPEGRDPARHLATLQHPNAWASCVIVEAA